MISRVGRNRETWGAGLLDMMINLIRQLGSTPPSPDCQIVITEAEVQVKLSQTGIEQLERQHVRLKMMRYVGGLGRTVDMA